MSNCGCWTTTSGVKKHCAYHEGYADGKDAIVAAIESATIAKVVACLRAFADAPSNVRLADVLRAAEAISRGDWRKYGTCTPPNGRTDAHGSYVRAVDGVLVCDFCGKPTATAGNEGV